MIPLMHEMKTRFLLIVIVVLAVALAAPGMGYAGRYYYRGPHRHYGWYGPGAFVGGVVVGSAFARPWYYGPAPVYVYPAPAAVYANPAPAYTYPQGQAYAYPDPNYQAGASGTEPSSESVTVPGQWVNGTWVPPHEASVSAR